MWNKEATVAAKPSFGSYQQPGGCVFLRLPFFSSSASASLAPASEPYTLSAARLVGNLFDVFTTTVSVRPKGDTATKSKKKNEEVRTNVSSIFIIGKKKVFEKKRGGTAFTKSFEFPFFVDNQ